MKKKISFLKRLQGVIPGGSHTYSKGHDQFSSNAPVIINKGKGSYLFDRLGNQYLDYGMGCRSVNIGYGESSINKAAYKEICKGNNLTKPSHTELEAAENFVNLIDSADMVKFTKNGSSAVTAAVKLARAYTGRDIVLICEDNPFLSYDDWFIGSTVVKKGIPRQSLSLTKKFKYNDINSINKLVKNYKNRIACVVMEPVTDSCPLIDKSETCCMKAKCTKDFKYKDHFLKQVQKICNKNKIIFILDEMITGFRWDLKGSQHFFNIKPDLSTFGKSMANGFSLAAVCGRKDIMELGSVNMKKREKVFLLSTTHGAEMGALGAFLETLKFIKKNKVIEYNKFYGENLIKYFKEIIFSLGLENNFKVEGSASQPIYKCLDINGNISLDLKTLFLQEMAKNKILIPWISICFRHKEEEIKKTLNSFEKSLIIYKKGLLSNVKKYLQGSSVKPVFRKYA